MQRNNSTKCIFLATYLLIAAAGAQQGDAGPPSQRPQPQGAQPQVKVNVLNVCTPSAEEQKEIAQALQRIPKQPLFAADFEVSRGRATLDQSPTFLQPGQGAQMSGEDSTASYVRIRREFSVQATFARLQYSFSNDGHSMVETLVLHVRDPKDLIQVAIEDSAVASVSPAVMLSANTPASRVRLERFGKSSIAMARCSGADGGQPVDQSAYEPLFRSASDVLANYRRLLGTSSLVPAELARLAPLKAGSAKPAATKKAK